MRKELTKEHIDRRLRVICDDIQAISNGSVRVVQLRLQDVHDKVAWLAEDIRKGYYE
jgi:hypothetical protein